MSGGEGPRQLCCAECWHSPEKPCAKLVGCLTDGPACHESAACRASRLAFLAGHRRMDVAKPTIFVGAGTCGMAAGAGQTLAAIREHLAAIACDATLVEVGCIGLCVAEPLVDIQIPGRARVSFGNVEAKNAAHLIDQVVAGRSVDPAMLPKGIRILGYHRPAGPAEPWPRLEPLDQHPFFRPQMRWVLENCGVIDPWSIEEYLAAGGYRSLAKVVGAMTPAEICDIVEMAGLRGRGGGGFPTGRKWKIALARERGQKYFICNADEGDPGAFMDRAVIEGDPHRVLEGLIIGACAIGASVAYVYIRAEYPLAIAHLEHAIRQAKQWGFIGKNILDSGFDIEVKIKQGAGAFVCGEETALIHSIEGKRGMPRPRPPYPAVQGLFGRPTVINNVETLANLPKILEHGARWFSSVGTKTSKGTKVFALSGKVSNTGLIEVAMGTKVREIIFDIGGGIPNGREFKAAQMGGPSGGCVARQHLDIEIDYESLKTIGAMMGSGGMVVMDDATCMVDVAKFFMEFIQRESCGKCVACREGTRQMLEVFRRVTQNPRNETGYDALTRMQGVMNLQQLAEVIRDTSLCGLGQTASNPVLSTMRWFMEEYEEHVYDRKCSAKACRELLTYTISAKKCKGCMACLKKCPSDAIKGAHKAPHYVIPEKCIGCGTCVEVCRLGAVQVA
jgi:NADH:ubiquinone oxidoreductase subunit F (NADH-binding)/NAD-dependent dihydropyrimidine dehydrogenase PreA subunit/(2Fe-2S) ferredoxin